MRLVEFQRRQVQVHVNIGGYGWGLGAHAAITRYTVWGDLRLGPLYVHMWYGWEA